MYAGSPSSQEVAMQHEESQWGSCSAGVKSICGIQTSQLRQLPNILKYSSVPLGPGVCIAGLRSDDGAMK